MSYIIGNIKYASLQVPGQCQEFHIDNWYNQFPLHATISTILDVFFMNDTIGIIVFLGIKLLYIFGIITKLGLYFLAADNKETMMKM